LLAQPSARRRHLGEKSLGLSFAPKGGNLDPRRVSFESAVERHWATELALWRAAHRLPGAMLLPCS